MILGGWIPRFSSGWIIRMDSHVTLKPMSSQIKRLETLEGAAARLMSAKNKNF